MSVGRSLLYKLLMYKWSIAFILLTASIDYYTLINYLPLLTTTDDRMKLITPLATFNSILLASAGIMYQVQAANYREIMSRIHTQRREVYLQLLDFIAKIFDSIKKDGTTTDIKTIISNKEFLDLHFKMASFASKEVLETYNKIRNPDKEALERDSISWAILNLGSLFKLLRKEIGFQEKDVPVRQMLGLWMNDVNDQKYDAIFKKLK